MSFSNKAYTASAYTKHSPKEYAKVGTYTQNHLALVSERVGESFVKLKRGIHYTISEVSHA